jgi:YVTN family beta-propeller protein
MDLSLTSDDPATVDLKPLRTASYASGRVWFVMEDLPMQVLIRSVGVATLAALLTACGGGGPSSSNVPNLGFAANVPLDDTQRALQMIDPMAATPAGRLYVSNFSGRNVLVFATAHGNALLSVITGGGMTNPVNPALDATGKLYVPNGGPSNMGQHTVSVFDTANDNAPLAPVVVGKSGPPQVPIAVAVGAGKLYVASTGADGFGSHRLMVYSTAPRHERLQAVDGADLDGPFALAVGTSGKLYVANKTNNTVSIFDTLDGNEPLAQISDSSLNGPDGITISAGGLLYVANGADNSVSVFDTTNAYARVAIITGGGLTGPNGIAIDSGGKLFVANTGANSISVFDTLHGNAAQTPITGSGLNSPDGLAVH